MEDPDDQHVPLGWLVVFSATHERHIVPLVESRKISLDIEIDASGAQGIDGTPYASVVRKMRSGTHRLRMDFATTRRAVKFHGLRLKFFATKIEAESFVPELPDDETLA